MQQAILDRPSYWSLNRPANPVAWQLIPRGAASDVLSFSTPHNVRKNQVLAALPEAEWQAWERDLELVELSVGQVLYESGRTPAYVYFPTTAIVSLLYMTEGGASSEIAVVGNDGVVGVSLLMSGADTPNQALVQNAGHAYRMRAQVACDTIHRGGVMHRLVIRYAQAMLTQVAQTAVCNRHHSIDQQLCRRLLLSLERLPTNNLLMTHEMLASLLGVRRESVTTAAHKLQQAGVIHYSRGHITVLDRQQLEQRSCECYAVDKKESRRFVGMPLAF